jgi:DNA-binding beta-propeller fold protein YncE
MRKAALILVCSGLLALGGCSHDPVYPSIGSLYVSTDPVGAEVLIDGRPQGRFSPAKIDGITVGWHQVSLRYYRCREWTQRVEIRPGQTRNLIVRLNNISPSTIQTYALPYYGLDMAYEPEARRIYIANRTSPNLMELVLGDSTVTATNQLAVGSWQYLVAASARSDRIYAKINGDTMAVLGLSSGALLRKIPPSRPLGIRAIAFSPDGQLVYVSNSSDSSLSCYQAGADTLLRTIHLAGSPGEVRVHPVTGDLYVLYDLERRLERLNAAGGEVLASGATGSNPWHLFWGPGYREIGVCNSTDRTLTVMDAAGLGGAVSPVFTLCHQLADAGYSPSGSYLWAVMSFLGGDPPPPPGNLALIYVPTWQFVGYYPLGLMPVRMAQSPDGRFIYVLNSLSRNLTVLRTDLQE